MDNILNPYFIIFFFKVKKVEQRKLRNRENERITSNNTILLLILSVLTTHTCHVTTLNNANGQNQRNRTFEQISI